MELSINGQNFIKNFEGCRLEAYICPAGKPTIGYGHTNKVLLGDKITQAEADWLFVADIKSYVNAVNKLVRVPLTQNQFDALVSFAYNEGISALSGSTLLKKINNKDYKGATKEFLRWNKITVKGKLVVCKGLSNRRKAEMEMFLQKI